MSDYTPKVGDRVKVTIEAEVLERGSLGPHLILKDSDFGREHKVWIERSGVTVEKIEPAVETFGPGDIVREKGSSVYVYALGRDGFFRLYGDFKYEEYGDGRYMVGKNFFTSKDYEKVEVPA